MSREMNEVEKPKQSVSLTIPPLTRTTLALFAGASFDHNPMHIDIDFARSNGRDDVFGHGMLTMAYMGRLLSQHFSLTRIVSFNVRFSSITNVNDEITCSADLKTVRDEKAGPVGVYEIAARDQNLDLKISGTAEILLSINGA